MVKFICHWLVASGTFGAGLEVWEPVRSDGRLQTEQSPHAPSSWHEGVLWWNQVWKRRQGKTAEPVRCARNEMSPRR
jgi:hypothetical protein